MTADPNETAFQKDIISQMGAGGWKLGDPAKYDRTLELYTEDCLAYVKTTQPKTWEKYQKLYPGNAEQAFIDKLASQLSKVDPQASDKSMRTFGTLGVLRHELRDKSVSFKMCQFKPEHGLNPDTLAMYEGNILRVVPELVYSPYATLGRRRCQVEGLPDRLGPVRQRNSGCDHGAEKRVQTGGRECSSPVPENAAA